MSDSGANIVHSTLSFTPFPKSLAFCVGNEPVLTFHEDGRVVASDKHTPDEIAQKVLEIITTQFPGLLQVAVAAEREACADIADAYNDPDSDLAYGKDARMAASEIAASIRRRKP